ncbi:MAG: MOSC domain-containing protein [Melioribacteraceae bacterium]|jgi:MOSC domain-containing protein YiiM|nr:MOSC domain-containing protein [Melioribacteraceae bacterium]
MDAMTNTIIAGKIKAISTSKRKGIAKSNVSSAKLIENWGIDGDAHAGNWHRQISFLAIESIDKMRKTLPKLQPGMFAENITTEFIDIPNLKIGSRVKIGEHAELEITQIGKECHDKCAIYVKVGNCVMPTEGIFAKVIHNGDIFVDDNVEVIN